MAHRCKVVYSDEYHFKGTHKYVDAKLEWVIQDAMIQVMIAKEPVIDPWENFEQHMIDYARTEWAPAVVWLSSTNKTIRAFMRVLVADRKVVAKNRAKAAASGLSLCETGELTLCGDSGNLSMVGGI